MFEIRGSDRPCDALVTFDKRTFFIAGGGFFGSLALKDFNHKVRVIIADVNEQCAARGLVETVIKLEDLRRENLKIHRTILVVGDASETLRRIVNFGFAPKIVIPAIPRHFAADFYKRELEARGFKVYASNKTLERALSVFNNDLILSLDFKDATFTSSYMPSNVRCMLSCTQPNICPVTGRYKPKPMMQLIEECVGSIVKSIVLRVTRIGTFVGGFELPALWNFVSDSSRKALNDEVEVALATACRCHGVASFFRIVRC